MNNKKYVSMLCYKMPNIKKKKSTKKTLKTRKSYT